ncbi:hypothetical protein NDU88_007317 [Pleurodeles waltl]|uniref:Uncharacterized protein n=1 Tax=Pleurodeles waltl TaxID=8319 RepID=A0AAV7NTA3_PLEWA|nr:hypothetical protein NDU88_007317 [Pleurodeles waltl]
MIAPKQHKFQHDLIDYESGRIMTFARKYDKARVQLAREETLQTMDLRAGGLTTDVSSDLGSIDDPMPSTYIHLLFPRRFCSSNRTTNSHIGTRKGIEEEKPKPEMTSTEEETTVLGEEYKAGVSRSDSKGDSVIEGN